MHEAFLVLNGVRTKVSAHGQWLEESLKGKKDVVVIIPGNPGVTGFYDVFATTIHEQLGYPVWCIGHAGHNIPNERISPFPKMAEKPELYGLKEQIKHKVEFLTKYIPPDARIHLIGHSIGSYIILELLDNPLFSAKIRDVYLLFPTVERMAGTDHGIFLTRYVKPILWLIVFLAWIFTILPKVLQTILIHCYMYIAGVSSEHCDNIRNLIHPGVLKRVFFLAFEELDQVKERNNAVIKKNSGRITFYYGMKDKWAPGSFCEQLKADIPSVNAHISGYNHAFVLKRSKEIGYIVSDWIKAKD